jgi:hypothetical protein
MFDNGIKCWTLLASKNVMPKRFEMFDSKTSRALKPVWLAPVWPESMPVRLDGIAIATLAVVITAGFAEE